MNHDNFTEVTSVDAPDFKFKSAWALGYNTCLERTNAAELLQCLIELKDAIQYEHNINALKSQGKDWSKELMSITNAIKKATDQNK